MCIKIPLELPDTIQCTKSSQSGPNQDTTTTGMSTQTSRDPIRTRYLGHVIGYQPIRNQYQDTTTTGMSTQTSREPVVESFSFHLDTSLMAG